MQIAKIVLFTFYVAVTINDASALSEAASCSGVFYKSKKNEVPVFDKPETSAKVVRRLKLGEKVCYVGEEKGFAIIDEGESTIGTIEQVDEETASRLRYVRLVELFAPPRENQARSLTEGWMAEIKKQYDYIKSGGVPEDVLTPYWPFVELFPKKVDEQTDKKALELEEQEGEK